MGRKRGIILNKIGQTLFWTFAILLGFVNPLITFGLIILYYLPKIIQDLCQPCNDVIIEDTKTTHKREYLSPKMNSFSEDTLEDMK